MQDSVVRQRDAAERPGDAPSVQGESPKRHLRLPGWKRDAKPASPETQKRLRASAERLERLEQTLERLEQTQPDSPESLPETQGHPEASPESPRQTHPGAAGASKRPRRDAAESRRESRRQRRESKKAARESRASRLRRTAVSAASQATGRRYERTGVAVAGRQAVAHPVMLTVLALVAYASLRGEVNWAQVHLDWHGLLAYVVPAVLDGAGIGCTLYALDRIDKGESGLGFRLLSVGLIGMGVWINWWNALPTRDVTREAFFPVMTGATYLMVHLVMGAAKRDARRRQYGHKSKERPEPLPRFGVLPWIPGIGMPGRAFDALKEAVELRMLRSLAAATISPGVSGESEADAADAASVPGETQESGEESTADADDAPSVDPETQESDRESEGDAPSVPDLTGLTQTEAIRRTLDALGTQPTQRMAVMSHLRTHGYPALRPSAVTDVIRRERERRARTQADAGESVADAGDAESVPAVGE